MKNLKKVLSVALALAMALSLMTTAFATVPKASDLTGNDKVGSTYTQAVDAMVALGVINGVSGDVQAQGNITREQAAKIICTMLLGDNASSLSTTSAYFSDVAAARWSAPYIAYCVENGIVSGVGGGKFNPTGNVTGNQFAKMLLVALGYKADTEGYTGTNWAVNVSGDATDAGIYKGAASINKNAAATREQACLYAWNTIKATMVEYNTTGTSITIGDTSINVGGSKASAVYSGDTSINKRVKEGTPVDNKYSLEFGEKYFPKLQIVTSGSTDDFGAPSTTVKYSNTTVGNYAAAPVVTYTASMKLKPSTIASDLSGYTLGGKKVSNSTTYSTATVADMVYKNSTTPTAFNILDGKTIAADIAALTGNGTTVKVYANTDNEITGIVQITYTVGTVTAVTTTTSKTTYSIEKADKGTVSAIDYVDGDDTISYTTAPAKGDVVTYALSNGVYHVYPTTSVSGVQTAYSTAGTITVSGTVYTVATGATDGTNPLSASSFHNSSSTINISLDQFGYAVMSTSSAASTDYAYIAGTYGTLASSVDGDTPSAQVKAVKADGTVATYNLSLTKITTASSSNDYSYDSSTNLNVAVGDYIITGTKIIAYRTGITTVASEVNKQIGKLAKVYGYTISDNTIKLETIKTAAGSGMISGTAYYDKLVNDLGYSVTSKLGGEGDTIVCTSSTVYVVYNKDKGTASVYTGVSALPTTTYKDLDNNFVVIKATAGGVGTASVVFNDTATVTSDTVNYAYINSAIFSTNTVDGTTTYGYTGYLADGTTITLTTKSTDQLTTPGIYSYTSTNTTATGSLLVNANDVGIQKNLYAYGTFSVGGSVLTVKSGANTYYYTMNSTNTVMVNTLLSGVDGNSGYVVLEKNSGGEPTGNVAAIYVTAAGTASYTLTTTDMNYAANVYGDAACTGTTVANGTSVVAGTPLYVKLSDNTVMDTTKFTKVSGTDNTKDAIYKFVMPAAATTLPKAYTLTVDGTPKDVVAGASVTITGSGKYYTTDNTTFTAYTSGTSTYTMPAAATTITTGFYSIATPVIAVDGAGAATYPTTAFTVACNKEYAKDNDTITFTVTAASSVTTDTDDEFVITPNATGADGAAPSSTITGITKSATLGTCTMTVNADNVTAITVTVTSTVKP